MHNSTEKQHYVKCLWLDFSQNHELCRPHNPSALSGDSWAQWHCHTHVEQLVCPWMRGRTDSRISLYKIYNSEIILVHDVMHMYLSRCNFS